MSHFVDLYQVDLFITELERRLRRIENYGNLELDVEIDRTYFTLDAVREACSQVSGEIVGAGRRRAKIIVETLESRYNDAIPTRDSLEAKAQAGMRLMEEFLADLEARTHLVRTAGITHMIDGGWRIAGDSVQKAREAVDEGLEKARRAKESLKEHIEQALHRAKEHRLICYDDLPGPWRCNPYIIRGYRFSENQVDCVKSAFNLSNESVNIWSHAIGFLVVLAVAFYFYPSSSQFSRATKTDVFFVAIFFFAACKCLACSCIWHTMNSISELTLMERFACVDYTGISLLIAASIMTGEYTAFYCEPVSRWTYLIATMVLGVAGAILPWHPTFNRVDMAWLRVAFYTALAATGFAPIFQLTWMRGAAWSWAFYSTSLKSVAFYFIGALIYAARVPERWMRGWFDYVGCSHQIWHLAVLGGILFHYSAMETFFADAFERSRNNCINLSY